MTIQIPDPGTGVPADKTGDDPWTAMRKVKHNFENTTHAASREVGTSTGNVAEITSNGIAGSGILTQRQPRTAWGSLIESGVYGVHNTSVGDGTGALIASCVLINMRFDLITQTQIVVDMYDGSILTRTINGGIYRHDWAKTYTDKNTTLDGNGALKPSSPVLRVFSDHIEGNADGDAMSATYTKNGVGDYTITGTTGLRTDGWYVVIPNDMNGNPKVAIGTLDDTDGVITLKTYVRIFDMSTFKFVPDLEQPLDIPEGRWIDLRFNDLLIDDDTLTDEV